MKHSDDQMLLPLLIAPVQPDGKGKRRTSQERFDAFHSANPHVYQAIRNLVSRAIKTGMTRWSMKGVFELLRWEWHIQTQGKEGDYRLDNTFTRFYAELLTTNEPATKGFFELRKRKTP